MKSIIISTYLLTATSVFSQNISLTGTTYTQDFNTLSSTAGTTTNSLVIAGWYMTEGGGGARDNEQYAVDAGASSTGDTYSYGSASNSERALGSQRTGTLIPLFGSGFTNNTGSAITSIRISYTGEQWRLGVAGRTDGLEFQYSTDATSIVIGTWTNVAALDFITPNTATTGAKDGNSAGNRTAITSTITGLNIAIGASFFIRWTDLDVAGADDGLAIDDFSIETNVVLPLSLINFSATKEGVCTKLSWTTAEEVNTALFKVQRSINGSNWQAIAAVKAAEQSTILCNYQAVDANPA